MMRHLACILLVHGLLDTQLVGATQASETAILRTDTIQEICAKFPPTSIRQTFVYVDISSVSPQDVDWGLAILNKLSLGAREPLTIFAVNPSDMSTRQVFQQCNPILTPDEMEQQAANRTLVDKLLTFDVEDQQKDNIDSFETSLKGALNSIASEGKRFAGASTLRNVFEAIALDKDRFASDKYYTRIIVYSNFKDGLSQSIDGSADGNELLSQFAKHFPQNMPASEVSVFGVKSESGRSIDKLDAFFRAYLQLAGARLAGLASALPQQHIAIETDRVRYSGSYVGGGARGRANLDVFLDAGANVARPTLFFSIGGRCLLDSDYCYGHLFAE